MRESPLAPIRQTPAPAAAPVSNRCGPRTTLLTLELTENKNATRLTVSDALYGLVTEKQAESLRSGWQQMFDEGLRKFVEAG